jgi:hypothetical protein
MTCVYMKIGSPDIHGFIIILGFEIAVQLLGIPKPVRHTVLDIILIESTPIVHAQLQVVYSSWDNIVILCWFTNYIYAVYIYIYI